MKKNRSFSIPEKLPDVFKNKRSGNKSYRSKATPIRSSLPSSQEFYYLQRENQDLRGRLRALNDRLNIFIQNSSFANRKSVSPEPPPNQNKETLAKNLVYYENEYKRLENRQKLLSDPGYEVQLKGEVEKLREKLAGFEDRKKKNEAKQKIREKSLNTVLDTGELGELHTKYTELNTEVTLFTKRYNKLKNLNDQTLQSYKDMTKKFQEFDEEFNKLKKDLRDHDETKPKNFQENKEKLRRIFEVISAKYESNYKSLSFKAKKLEEELSRSQVNEDEITQKISALDEEHRTKIKVLASLQSRNIFNDRGFFGEADDNIF